MASRSRCCPSSLRVCRRRRPAVRLRRRLRYLAPTRPATTRPSTRSTVRTGRRRRLAWSHLGARKGPGDQQPTGSARGHGAGARRRDRLDLDPADRHRSGWRRRPALGVATNPEKGAVLSVGRRSIAVPSRRLLVGNRHLQYTVIDGLGARATGTVRVGISPRLEGARNPVADADDGAGAARTDRVGAGARQRLRPGRQCRCTCSRSTPSTARHDGEDRRRHGGRHHPAERSPAPTASSTRSRTSSAAPAPRSSPSTSTRRPRSRIPIVEDTVLERHRHARSHRCRRRPCSRTCSSRTATCTISASPLSGLRLDRPRAAGQADPRGHRSAQPDHPVLGIASG